MLTYNFLVQTFLPAPQEPVRQELAENPNEPGEPAADQADVVNEPEVDSTTDDRSPADTPAQEPAASTAETRAIPTDVPQQWFSLGSLDPSSPYRMMVVLTNRGAAVETVTLNGPQYKELNDRTMFLSRTGYLGGLVLSKDPNRDGCRVEMVGPGTPAARAQPTAGASDTPAGLRGPTYEFDGEAGTTLETPGDLLLAIDGQPVRSVSEFQQRMATTRPGQTLPLTLLRSDAGQEKTLTFSVTLARRPLEILNQEPRRHVDGEPRHPPSFLVSLTQLGEKTKLERDDEIVELPSLRNGNWTANPLDGPDGPGIEFRRTLTEDDLAVIGQTGRLEVIKRYRLATVPEDQRDNSAYPAFHLTFELEIRNLSEQDRQVAYQLDGPTGLTEEGWWYSYKPGGSGARDVVWASDVGGFEVFGCSKIVKEAEKKEKRSQVPGTALFAPDDPPVLKCVGTDSQYFAAVFVRPPDAVDNPEDFRFSTGVARPVAGLNPDESVRSKLTDVSCRLTSRAKVIPTGKSFRQSFQIYVGPKRTALLEQYGLQDLIVYGWFGAVSKVLLSVLHFFHDRIVGNYGLAIIMLTILVRACMFPISRKMALNARRMQELAPEMKKIAEKHKNEMEKRTQAQRELYQKHNFNPFGGCLLMFLQLPIFIGLYRGLSVDVLLRQAPLIPGISWCSNLAGPDKLYFWADMVPGFLSNPTGWLGPYLNVLPLVTCILFLLQQKMFTPPATDDQQKMQQQVMQFMMLFMAVLFFKVASGLCIYFIASSVWGLTERMLLPKSKPVTDDQPLPKAEPSSGNGSTKAAEKAKRKRQRRR